MYQRILVPVDGSPASARGLQEAIGMARTNNATLKLVHVVNEFVLDPGYAPASYYDAVLESFRITGAEILARAQATARAAGVKFESELIETIGRGVSQLILDAARLWSADLIVMGTHGRRGLRRVAMGSDAEMVLRSSTVPLLLVREETQDA